MIIIDDAFPSCIFKSIKEKITNSTFEWNYIPGSAFSHPDGDKERQNFHFTHTYNKSKITPIFQDIIMGFTFSLRETNLNLSEIIRIKINLIPTVSDFSFIGDPHIDTDKPHKNAILYLNDSEDGGTIIYKERYDPNSNLTAKEQCNQILDSKLSILKNIIPKENRMVIFDGYNYHAHTTPTKIKARFAININFTTKDMID